MSTKPFQLRLAQRRLILSKYKYVLFIAQFCIMDAKATCVMLISAANLCTLPGMVSTAEGGGDLGTMLKFVDEMRRHLHAPSAVTIVPVADACFACLDLWKSEAAASMSIVQTDFLGVAKVRVNEKNCVKYFSSFNLGNLSYGDVDMIAVLGNWSTSEDTMNSLAKEKFLLIPWSNQFKSGKSLRLDSKLYLYRTKSPAGHTEVFERYSVQGGEPITQRMGTWTPLSGLHVPQNIWWRRADLRGAHLLNGLREWGIINRFPPIGSGLNDTIRVRKAVGIFADIVLYLSKELNFSVTNVPPNDGQWGGLEADGVTWNGLIKMLLDKG